ncbi:GNAT family N-acetyltransferase [Candidatus Thorarchaeota archaeon]|nr:MAG: GNAT family N-acetyltransferase [Candidatus Thorarchaeota archaeon]
MRLPFRVVQATCHDTDTIVDVVNSDRLYKTVIPSKFYKDPFLTSEELKNYFATMDLTFFLCREGASVLGVGALIGRKDGDGQLGWIFVVPERQREGVGSALVATIERQARARGMPRIILETDGGAYWAISFYQSLGYREYKRTDHLWGYQIWIQKALSPP